ncbi:hypothetical protein ABIE45_000362 [Methylobacterium sp. OAE515]|uniref:hypothetical protein n=1 Tax=Methylobacterium sp. OAE515 TaxID=2817895 RepID=UPI00178A3E3E
MTAVNVITHRERVTVCTDTACYDGGGYVQGFTSKAIALPHWPGVIALRGPLYVLAQLAVEAGLRFADVDAFAEGAPDFLADFLEQQDHLLGQHGEIAGIQVTVAGLSRARNACRAFVVQAGEKWDVPGAQWMQGDAVDLPVGEILDLPLDVLSMSPPVPDADVRRAGIDPDADLSSLGMAGEQKLLSRIMGAQRQMRLPLNAGLEPIRAVGGQPVYVTVFRDGTITTSAGTRWPDRTGNLIGP